ncbi:MAG: FtsX-like permease family protein [Burkholderiales bacterium]|nr:FtsX-like permease family protein [Burkholderiales bacterium]
MNDLMLSLRLLLREARSGELTVLFLSVLIAVSAMTTVGFFAERVKSGIEGQAQKLLGADIAVSSDHPLDAKFPEKAQSAGLRVTEAMHFPSMASFGDRSLLTAIRAIENGYPLRGEMKLSNGKMGIPERGTVWGDAKLFARLGVHVGDRISIGDADFTLSAQILDEPGAAFSFMSLGPGIVMNREDLARTGLISTGSRVRYLLYAAGEEGKIAAFRTWAKKNLGRGQGIEDAREGSPELRQMLDRSEVFLRMASLLCVVLAGVAITLAARRFVSRHLDSCAIMRVMGTTRPRLFRIFLLQFSFLGLFTSAFGILSGYFAQDLLAQGLSGVMNVHLPAPSPLPALEGGAAGMLLFLGFALPPIYSLAGVPPMHVIRRESGTKPAGFLPGLALLFALFLWQARDWKLGLIVFGGSSAMLAASGFAAILFIGRIRGGGAGWRYGIASLRRRSATSAVQILAFGLGLMAILVLTLVRGDLFRIWHESLPENAPNRFVLNIQPQALQPVKEFMASNGIGHPEFFPMVKGRLVGINDRQVSSDDYREMRAKHLVDREFNLSWASSPENELAAGRWWKEGEKDAFSVEEGIAKTLSIRMGDRLTFEVAGETVSGRVVNLRKVNWNSFRVNFFVIAPPSMLDSYPASYITSFHLPAQNQESISLLAKRFPTLLVVDVSTLIAKMQKMMNQVASSMQFVFLYSLLAGALVLFAAFASTQDERMREAAIMRALGADTRQILAAHASEFLILGIFSGAFAALGASAIGYFASTRLLDLPYHFDPQIFLIGISAGAIGVVLTGLHWTRKVLKSSPLAVLREV